MSAFGNRAQWVSKPLIDVATLQRGYDLPVQDRTSGPHPIFAANGPVGLHGIAKCKGPGVVTGRSGTIGKVHFVQEDYWPLNTSLYVKDFHGNDPKWVYYMLQSFGLEGYSQGAGVPTLNRNLVHGEPVKVPPLEEQRRIAAILDQAETLRTQRRQALAHLDTLTQSLFLDMFGDPVTNDRGWLLDKLGKQTLKMGSGSTPTGGDTAYKAEGISLIRSLNVHDGAFKYKNLAFIDDQQAAKLSNVQVETDDVLLNITGASVARVCRAPANVLPARVNQHVMIIRPKTSINCVFLERLLLSDSMKNALLQIGGSGATREAITKAQAEDLAVPVPPLPLQQTFATRIQAIETLKTTHRTALAQLDALFASLQQRAFAGEL